MCACVRALRLRGGACGGADGGGGAILSYLIHALDLLLRKR